MVSGFSPYADRFAFGTQATNKMYGRMIFKFLKVCDCVHVYINLTAIRAG